MDLTQILLAIQQSPELQERYGVAYVSLREHAKQLKNDSKSKDSVITLEQFAQVMKGFQIPDRPLNFLPASQFAMVRGS